MLIMVENRLAVYSLVGYCLLNSRQQNSVPKRMVMPPNIIVIGSYKLDYGVIGFANHLLAKCSLQGQAIGVTALVIDPQEGENKPINGYSLPKGIESGFELVEGIPNFISANSRQTLNARAGRVFVLAAANREALRNGLTKLLGSLPADAAVVVVTNSARSLTKGGLIVGIRDTINQPSNDHSPENLEWADSIVGFDGTSWDYSPDRFRFINGTWTIREEATAIVLAGGKSTRMGGTDKSLLPVNGIPLIRHVVNQLEVHFDEILIGANTPEKYQFLSCKVVPDLDPGVGPLMGIRSCLMASSNDTNFITACDIPEINIRFIHRMVSMLPGYDMVVPAAHGDLLEPLFAVYRKSVAKEAGRIIENGGRKVSDLIRSLNVKYIDFTGQDWYRNLNTRAAYRIYMHSLSQPKKQ